MQRIDPGSRMGSLSNMLASDCMAFREALVHIHQLWAVPLQLLLMIPIMALTFGMSCSVVVGLS
jgi:hypothetical protein